MKVIIIEDEKIASDLLQQMLLEIDVTIEIVDRCYDLSSGIKSIKKHEPELLFLDVELPVYSGLQLLDFFNEDDIDFKIIFTTASNQHAIQAFEMSAIDYVLKPIQQDKLKQAINKYKEQAVVKSYENLSALTQNIQTPNIKKIVIPVSTGFEILNVKDIIYIKAEGSYTKIYLKNNISYTMSKNLKYFESVFETNISFVRIHRSYLVNINFITRIIKNDGFYAVFGEATQLPIINDKIEEVIKLISS
jgi:two-component system LytT family response regulator